MDTISRENNSMLPVGGIIVGVIALLLGGYSAITLSQVKRSVAEQQAKMEKIDSVEMQIGTAAAAAEKAGKDVQGLTRSTQDAFNTVAGELTNLRAGLTKLEESTKRPAPAPASAAKKGEPVVAGPGEYVVKPGDGGAKIARAQGVSLQDLQAVNPGVNWNSLKIGQKLKLPKK